MELFFFYIFATILLLSAFMVILNKNSVHAVLYLVLVFCSNSCILLLLGTDFLSLILLVVYIGAIAILFLFVVMLLPIKEHKEKTFLQDLPIGFMIGAVLCIFVLFLISSEIPSEVTKEYTLNGVKTKFKSSLMSENYIGFSNHINTLGQIVENPSQVTEVAISSLDKIIEESQKCQIFYTIPTEMTNYSDILISKENINIFGIHLYETYFYYTFLRNFK